MKREVADGVTIVGEFSWSMSVLTGRSNFNRHRDIFMRIWRADLIVHFPGLVLTGADVAAIPVFLMGKKETHGAVLRKIEPLNACSHVRDMTRDRQNSKRRKNRWQSRKKFE